MIINEYTQSDLIKKSKDQKFNRYDRRMLIDKHEISIDYVRIGRITTSPDLDIYFKVRDYTCSVRMINFMTRVRNLNIRSKYRNDIRKMLTLAFNSTLKNNDLLVNCTCPDFYYRFSYVATRNKYGFNTNQSIPALVRNPDNKGSMCKHLVRIINAPSLWKNKVITAIMHVLDNDPSLLGGDDI